jgi:hypothetical protein
MNIFWLAGMAGTGKTAIAKTFAQSMDRDGILGGSFFVDRQLGGRRHADRIVQTLAYFLARQSHSRLLALWNALQSRPDICEKGLDVQIRKLIEEPLRVGFESSEHTMVIVIDALDECLPLQGAKLVQALTTRLSNFPIKMLFTSRNELDISEQMGKMDLSHTHLHLHEIDKDVVADDVRQYYVHHFGELGRQRNIGDWHSCVPIDSLVFRTGHLFIHASTVMSIITTNRRNPFDKLQQLLAVSDGSADTMFASSRDEHQLDILYRHILNEAVKNKAGKVNHELVADLQNVLEVIVLAVEPLSVPAIAQMLEMLESDLRDDLGSLTSVLLVPGPGARDNPVRPLHQSFPDFLRSHGRNPNGAVHISINDAHARMANRCLRLLNTLGRNMCHIHDPTLLNSEVPDLDTLVASCFPAQLIYSLQHWPHHIVASKISAGDTLAELRIFCLQHVLHWIEASSFFPFLRHMHRGLSAVVSISEVHRFDFD